MKSLVFGGLLCIATMSCSSDSDSDDNPAPINNPDLGVGDVAGPDQIVSTYRSSSNFFSLSDGLQPSDNVHGDNQIWYTKSVNEFVGSSGFVAPVGTASVKEFDSNKDGVVDGLAVMIKREPGYDSENNDWYYEMRDADGNVKAEPAPGKIQMCIGCHGKYTEQDYLPGLLVFAN